MSTRRIQQEAPSSDGRRLRREQGRLAVIDAMIDLVSEGHAPPSADQIAQRAGVSQASVYRYFTSLDELRHHGVQRYFERYSHLMAIPDVGEHSRARRIENLVEARLRYHEASEPMARLARRQADQIDELRETLSRVRSTLVDQIDQHFEPELAGLRPAARRERVAIIAAVTSFESWDQLRDQGLDRASIARALRRGIERLLPRRSPRRP